MARKKIDHSGVIPLCTAFMIEVNKRSGGEIFKSQPARDVTQRPPERAVDIVQEFIAANSFANRFPQLRDQDSIGYVSLQKSGVEFSKVKKALVAEGLEGLMHIVGHAAHTFHCSR